VKKGKLLIILLIVALVVAYYLFGTGYLKLRQENEALASEITSVTGNLMQIPSPPADLEQRLAAAQAAFNATKNEFPEKLNTTQIVNTILELADDVGVKAIPLVTKSWTTESINQHDYSVFRFDVVIRGTSEQLAGFLRRLEHDEIETLVIENLSVNKENEASVKVSISKAATRINASLSIAVYAQSPVAEPEEKET
jgi:hypothetical protein